MRKMWSPSIIVPIVLICCTSGAWISAQVYSPEANKCRERTQGPVLRSGVLFDLTPEVRLAQSEAASQTDYSVARGLFDHPSPTVASVDSTAPSEPVIPQTNSVPVPDEVFQRVPQRTIVAQNRKTRSPELQPIPRPSVVFDLTPNFADERVTQPVQETKILQTAAAVNRTFRTHRDSGVARQGQAFGTQNVDLSVDWVTPESILVGQQGNFELVVRNRGSADVEQLQVHHVLPSGFQLVKATPEPIGSAQQPVWKIDRLGPQQEARISLLLIPQRVGDTTSRARIDFSVSAASKFRVVEPKLELIAEALKTVIVGDQVVFTITVRNPGSGQASNVTIGSKLGKGLVQIEKDSTFQLAVLNPGESRSIQIHAKPSGRGRFVSKFFATADNGLNDEAVQEVTALGAELQLVVDGPSFRYVTRPASYSVRIKNSGTASAQNVALRCAIPKAFGCLDAGGGGRFDSTSKTVNWFVGKLDAGQEFVGTFKLRAQEQGEYPILAQAVAERDLRAQTQHITKVDGIAALLLEVVDVADPIEVGVDTYYEILVTNQGTDFARDMEITANLPDTMKIISTEGPTNGRVSGQTVRFVNLSKLAPRADAIYRVKVRTLKPGDARIEVQMKSARLKVPVMELESTQVYSD